MVLEKYLNDYYKGKISNREIADREGIEEHNIAKILRGNGYKTYHDVFKDLDFKNKKLKSVLIRKYASLKDRCLGLSSDKYGHYKGMDYLTIIEWVNFCNKNKEILNKMWEIYINSNKNLKYAISVDRINNNEGYRVDNIQFVIHGFNSWKSAIHPVEVTFRDKSYFFMSCEEGSRYFKLNPRALGECFRQSKYCNKNYKIKECSAEKVLKHQGYKTIEEYYDNKIK